MKQGLYIPPRSGREETFLVIGDGTRHVTFPRHAATIPALKWTNLAKGEQEPDRV